MPKITDEQYRYLSRAVYFVGKFPNQYRKGRMVTIHGRNYVVEDVESNEKNGLQALAVTPKDAPDELVIAYGGTDPADIRDALTDIEFIALGREHRPWRTAGTVSGRSLRKIPAYRNSSQGSALMELHFLLPRIRRLPGRFCAEVRAPRRRRTHVHDDRHSSERLCHLRCRQVTDVLHLLQRTGHQRHPVCRRMRLHQKPPLRVQKLPQPRRHYRQRHSRPSRLRNHRRGTARIP